MLLDRKSNEVDSDSMAPDIELATNWSTANTMLAGQYPQDKSNDVESRNPASQGSDTFSENTQGSVRGQENTLVEDEKYPEPEILLQPDIHPVGYEEIADIVESIYSGLITVEEECIDVQKRLLEAVKKEKIQIKDSQWQSLIAQHKQLLHEQYDFLVATSHPSGRLQLSSLPREYSMHKRIWSHGVHDFLEILKHQLPESKEHMITFIHTAYSMLTLMLKTVPTSRIKWIECLGMTWSTLQETSLVDI